MGYKYKDNSFPVSRFFAKVIFIILIILLVTWLYSKYTNRKTKEEENLDLTAGQVFSNNLNTIKKVALKYYDEKTVNAISTDTDKVNLKTLYKKKLINKIKDKDNKRCYLENSYIELNKNENVYTMKIYLACPKESDYINVSLEHNDNCNTYLCEIKKEKKSVNNEEQKPDVNTINEYHNIENNIKESITTTRKKKTKTTYTGSIEIIDTTNERYIYQYIKTNQISYSPWSNWTYEKDIACNSSVNTCNDSTICLKEEKIEKYAASKKATKYITNKISLQKTGSNSIKVCKNVNYILFNNTLYQTKNDYSNINNWVYLGRSLYNSSPKDTLNTKYVYAGIDYSKCNTNCNGNEKYYYDKYIYYDIFPANNYCSNYIYKVVDSYSYQSTSIINYRNENTNLRCYKEIRTRSILNTNDYVWSTYNNTILLNNGYQYTGRKEVKK